MNVSPSQLADACFTDQVLAHLRATQTCPADLCLEITETALVMDNEEFTRRLELLADRGVQIALDDFGTGYSTVAQVANLPINLIKIDQSFVARADPGNRHAAVLAALLNMAESLAMSVVAEGIETADQARLLQALGCPEGQGYYFARPLELPALLALPTDQPLTAEPLLGAGTGQP